MSIYAVTAIRKCGTELYNEAQSWARTLDLPYIPRPIHGTLDQLLRDRGLKAVLVATHQGPQVYTEEGILKYHPSMGVPRIRNLKRGGSDHLAQASGFRPGMRVLDCTLGRCSGGLLPGGSCRESGGAGSLPGAVLGCVPGTAALRDRGPGHYRQPPAD